MNNTLVGVAVTAGSEIPPGSKCCPTPTAGC
ncbi:hypothetical protein ACNKHT_22570 [Shigella flexneri]